MSEPNEKILKRDVVKDEEAAQVTGGTSEEEVYCAHCGKTHIPGMCLSLSGEVSDDWFTPQLEEDSEEESKETDSFYLVTHNSSLKSGTI